MEDATQRFRMGCKYYLSQTTNCLAVGSVTRTDQLIGAVAKYGASAVDLALFGDLYTTELSALAEHLEIPFDLVSDPQIRSSHPEERNADMLGIDQSTFDSLLRKLHAQNKSKETVASELHVCPGVVQKIMSWYTEAVNQRRRPRRPSMAR